MRMRKGMGAMTTDNRMTNQFTDGQVEAAVNAAWAESMKYRGVGGQVVQAHTFEFIQVVHAALEAAAGVAPQALSVNRVHEVLNENSVVFHHPAYGYGLFTTGAAEIASSLATQVQPSSTVDEWKLAEVITKAGLGYNLSDRSGESYACGAPDYRSVYIARVVAEWLRGDGE